MKEDGFTKVTIVSLVGIVLIAVIAIVTIDPRQQAMRDCIGDASIVSEEHRLGCAQAIYGEDK